MADRDKERQKTGKTKLKNLLFKYQKTNTDKIPKAPIGISNLLSQVLFKRTANTQA